LKEKAKTEHPGPVGVNAERRDRDAEVTEKKADPSIEKSKPGTQRVRRKSRPLRPKGLSYSSR